MSVQDVNLLAGPFLSPLQIVQFLKAFDCSGLLCPLVCSCIKYSGLSQLPLLFSSSSYLSVFCYMYFYFHLLIGGVLLFLWYQLMYFVLFFFAWFHSCCLIPKWFVWASKAAVIIIAFNMQEPRLQWLLASMFIISFILNLLQPLCSYSYESPPQCFDIYLSFCYFLFDSWWKFCYLLILFYIISLWYCCLV